MNYLKRKLRIYAFKKLILWSLVISTLAIFSFFQYSVSEQPEGFGIFLLAIGGLMSLLIIHALWLTIFPYALREFKSLKNAYGITPEMIERSITEAIENNRLVDKKDVLMTDRFCVVQTIRYTKIIALDELISLDMKRSLDLLAYAWWLPRVFLYAKEERRKYRVAMPKKMMIVLCQRVYESVNPVKLPQNFIQSLPKVPDDTTLTPTEKSLKNMDNQLFMSIPSIAPSHWKKLIRFMLVSLLLLFSVFVLSISTALISPVIFIFAYILGAIIVIIIRMIQLFKVAKGFGGSASILVFIVSLLILLYMPKMVFGFGRWLIELYIGGY